MINWSKYKPTESQALIYLTVIYIIGVTGMLTWATLPIFMFLVPVNIIVAAFAAGLYHGNLSSKFILSCIIVYIGGFVIEWLGVKTGVIFGKYTYGEGLGLKLDGIPLIMGVNWLLLVYGSSVIASKYFRKKIWIAAIASGLMLLYDIFLEPSAIRYGFWTWDLESVPFQNYVAWYLGAFLFILMFQLMNPTPTKNKVAEGIFWLQLAFFGALWLGNN